MKNDKRVIILCLPAPLVDTAPGQVEAGRLLVTRLAILPDGNTRAPGGRRAGAGRVVDMVLELARRGDVGVCYVGVVSPENDERRNDDFIEEIAHQFLVLGTRIKGEGLFVKDGVRCLPHGDLEMLHRKGGARARLATGVEVVCGLTDGVRAPHMVLIFGVRYPPSILQDLDIPDILRTGMEEPGVVRLSGIIPHPKGLAIGSRTPWPAFEAGELHRVVDALRRHTIHALQPGYRLEESLSFLRALAASPSLPPVDVTLPLSCSAADASTLLRDTASELREVCVTLALDPARPAITFGAAEDDSTTVRLVAPSMLRSAVQPTYDIVLAPGQGQSIFALGGIPIGYATVHACAQGTEGLLSGLSRGARFARTYEPLRGGDRPGSTGCAGAVLAASGTMDASLADWHRQADVFAARERAWAAERGLLVGPEPWQRAKTNYDLTAFYSVPPRPLGCLSPDATMAIAEAMARYMVLVAAGDHGIFDRVFPDETQQGRFQRLEASARFLARAACGSKGVVPAVEGAGLLERIAEGLMELRGRYAVECHPAARLAWQRGMAALYGGSVAEYDPMVTANPLVVRFVSGARDRGSVFDAVERRYLARAPIEVGARVREILAGGDARPESVAELGRELTVYLYLLDVAPTIGASRFFETALLAWPAHDIDPGRITLLKNANRLLDMALRLQNDRTDLLRTATGDRDAHKENAGTILLRKEMPGVAQTCALIDADILCGRIVARLWGAFQSAAANISCAWPEMGAVVGRASAIGYGVYAQGHYETKTREEMAALAEQVDRMQHG